MIYKPTLLILYTSRTGNTESFVDYLEDETLQDFSYETINVLDGDQDLEESLIKADAVILGSYTWDNGRIPKEIKQIIIDNRSLLEQKTLFLFGSGITIWAHFCGALDNIEIILNRAFPKIKFELTFIPEEHKKDIKIIKREIDNFVNNVK